MIEINISSLFQSNLLLWFTTDKSTEKEIRVAIECLKVFIEHEEKEV